MIVMQAATLLLVDTDVSATNELKEVDQTLYNL